MVLKRRKIYHSARKTRADRERTRLPCNINPARLDSAIAVANFETRKTAASHNRACQRMNEPEEYRQCGIELRSARKLAIARLAQRNTSEHWAANGNNA